MILPGHLTFASHIDNGHSSKLIGQELFLFRRHIGILLLDGRATEVGPQTGGVETVFAKPNFDTVLAGKFSFSIFAMGAFD